MTDVIEIEGASGISVQLYTGTDGAPVIQIDTPTDTDVHEELRVWVNDALVTETTPNRVLAVQDPVPLAQDAPDWQPVYSPWRHGGWYVDNLRYPSGAVGCVSRNYEDRKWRIACDPRPFEEAPTFPNRDAAARGERDLIAAQRDRESLYDH